MAPSTRSRHHHHHAKKKKKKIHGRHAHLPVNHTGKRHHCKHHKHHEHHKHTRDEKSDDAPIAVEQPSVEALRNAAKSLFSTKPKQAGDGGQPDKMVWNGGNAINGIKPLVLSPIAPRDMSMIVNIAFLGRRNSGKTHFCKYVLQQFHNRGKIPRVIALSKTEQQNQNYQKMGIPDEYIRSSMDEAFIEECFLLQQTLVQLKSRKYGKPVSEWSIEQQLKNALIVVVDDLSYDRLAMRKCKVLTEIACNGRQSCTYLFLLSQEPYGIPPAIRNSFDYVVLRRESTAKTMRILYDEYFGQFDSFNQFKATMLKYTTGKHVLVSDRVISADSVQKQYAYSVAPSLESEFVLKNLDYAPWAKVRKMLEQKSRDDMLL